MDRRAFIKCAIGASAAVAAGVLLKKLPSAQPAAYSFGFNPDETYGNYFIVTDPPQYVAMNQDMYLDYAREDAERYIPKQYMGSVRFYITSGVPGGTADPLEQWSTVAWKYSPKVAVA